MINEKCLKDTTNMLVQEPVQAAVWHCLNHYAFADAVFLAERLLAEVNSDEALHLVATAYYRAGKIGRAYSILSGHTLRSPQLKYLMARCCYDLGKLEECEAVLAGTSVLKPRTVDELTLEYGHIACFALQLLGMVCRKTERPQRAGELLRRSLKLNPFMWQSFTTLCDQGDRPDPSRTFRLESNDNLAHCHGNTLYTAATNMGNQNASTPLVIHHGNTPVNQPQQQSNTTTPVQVHSMAALNTPVWISVTPANGTDSIEGNNTNNPLSIVGQPSKRRRSIGQAKRTFPGISALSPITPSFGILPLQEESMNSNVGCGSLILLTPTQSLDSSLTGNNNKRTGQLMLNKPNSVVFGPTANNSNFHHHHQSPATGQANVRRSSRLFGNTNNNSNNNSSSVKENNKGHHQRFVTPKSPATRKDKKTRSTKNHHQTSSLHELNEKNNKNEENLPTDTIIAPPLPQDTKKSTTTSNSTSVVQQASSIQKHSVDGLMNLLKDMGTAYLHLSQFECSKAIEQLSTLPAHHYHTGWVLAHVGKAYFEMNDYTQAVKAFAEAREREPRRTELMEYYSTALWHLQREVPLSALAQDLVENDKDAPQAWCTTGNCFSLQKEHETAIRFFSRAIQVDSNCAYAYTLLGHEHIATEELDRALNCYKSAVRVDPRHYNAWYGIGLVLFKQERFEQAESYFKKALAIHPHSSILMCHVAVVEHSLQKSTMALSTLNRALATEPRNPLCKYHRASILHSIDRQQEALAELLHLKEIVPKESNVYLLLGKVYKKLGQTHLALMNFSWAMDLDPKAASNQYKEAVDPSINRFPVDEEEDEEQQTPGRPQECGSEASSSFAPLESSQESLVLEDSVEDPQAGGRLTHPIPIMESLSDDSL